MPTRNELLAEAKKRGHKNYHALKKEDLVKLLQKAPPKPPRGVPKGMEKSQKAGYIRMEIAKGNLKKVGDRIVKAGGGAKPPAKAPVQGPRNLIKGFGIKRLPKPDESSKKLTEDDVINFILDRQKALKKTPLLNPKDVKEGLKPYIRGEKTVSEQDKKGSKGFQYVLNEILDKGNFKRLTGYTSPGSFEDVIGGITQKMNNPNSEKGKSMRAFVMAGATQAKAKAAEEEVPAEDMKDYKVGTDVITNYSSFQRDYGPATILYDGDIYRITSLDPATQKAKLKFVKTFASHNRNPPEPPKQKTKTIPYSKLRYLNLANSKEWLSGKGEVNYSS